MAPIFLVRIVQPLGTHFGSASSIMRVSMSSIAIVAGRQGMDINFATDFRVALDMLTKRKGGRNRARHPQGAGEDRK
jgi:hypothetical protein